jgi:hypothetical protein
MSDKPDSSNDLENEVKDDEQASEDVEGVKEEDVVESPTTHFFIHTEQQ